MSSFFDGAFDADPPIRVLDEDPDLFEGLAPAARADARARAVAPAMRLDPGPWDGTPGIGREPVDHLGLLVVEGVLVRSVAVARQPRSELLGAGDLLRPWDGIGLEASKPATASWHVIEPARLAVLDRQFLAAACRWPEVVSALVARALRRSRWLAIQLAIADLRRIEDRLMLLFWHLADRWGRVRPDGIFVPVRLTHEVVAQLVGAQRPTVTGALARLSQEGRLLRRADRTWLLADGGPSAAAPADSLRRELSGPTTAPAP